MGAHTLAQLFNPQGVALFGASERAGAVGTTVLANLIKAGFTGVIAPINPKYTQIQGLRCWADLTQIEPALAHKLDLAVIATPAATVPVILRQ